MRKPIVRLQSITIKNIKNVEDGEILMPYAFKKQNKYDKAEILGIYGQNGSGKTAIVDSVYFLQVLLSGSSIDKTWSDYVDARKDEAQIEATLLIVFENTTYDVTYSVKLARDGEDVVIVEESLASSTITADKRTNKTTIVCYERGESDVFTPKKRYDEIVRIVPEASINLIVAKKMAEKSKCSYIWGESSREIFLSRDENNQVRWDYAIIIAALFNFAVRDLFVIRNTHSGYITANIALPMAFRIDQEDKGIKGEFAVSLREPTLLDMERLEILKRIVDDIDTVLYTIIPGMKILVKDLGAQTLEDGKEGHRVELLSQHYDLPAIPIRMESEGIIKIVSILNAMIQMFSDPSICLVIDEMDSGIYEYMFGELLSISAQSAKGQLIFTSHNLRPLEMLDKDSIIFSTANSKKRYIHMKNVKSTNNLRDVYIRCITLGGQNEKLYEETDSLKIARAFRKAGRRIADVKQ
ncbi:hypothetical protein SAMN05216349_15110 [Oribacterium sp. KHPX15]|uniref:AAA family ATPase n=1 Tax=Oribacterium sp. KHPX15 TaxID=1855342 RepID=UPI00089925DB|nr:AAA family ATPase [Oribacterium sp. KHPX15]SEA91114.1 hypothetical protein SAMN05216349_15110 [Oribacterium sp. KHPX15]